MRFFFERALTQKIVHVLFAGERTVGLLAELRFVFFLGGFHSPNRNVCAGNLVPPTIQSPPDSVFENGWLDTEIFQFLFPTRGVSLFGLGHAQQNAFSFFVRLAPGQIAIGLGCLHFG